MTAPRPRRYRSTLQSPPVAGQIRSLPAFFAHHSLVFHCKAKQNDIQKTAIISAQTVTNQKAVRKSSFRCMGWARQANGLSPTPSGRRAANFFVISSAPRFFWPWDSSGPGAAAALSRVVAFRSPADAALPTTQRGCGICYSIRINCVTGMIGSAEIRRGHGLPYSATTASHRATASSRASPAAGTKTAVCTITSLASGSTNNHCPWMPAKANIRRLPGWIHTW